MNSHRIINQSKILGLALTAQIIFYLCNYFLAVFIARKLFNREDGYVLVYSSVLRNLSISLGLAATAFGPNAAFMVTIAFLLQQQVPLGYLNNSAAASQGGAGIKAAQFIVDNGVNALFTPRCGKNAADIINAANIKIYKTINNSIIDNIDALNEGKLSLLEEIHAGFHKHGGK